MELYHNQVTRLQGVFSLRMFHRSFGLLLIQANIQAPCSVLDFPTLERFEEELRSKTYDIIGITSILPNIGKVEKMCAMVRKYQPQATIVIGGHIANKPDLSEWVEADHIVRGDGVQWFRKYLGEDTSARIRHPLVYSGFGARVAGSQLRDKPGDTAAILIPSVGCPMGCDFCSTSVMFGGKGKSIHFYRTGDELFSLMCQIEERLRTSSFFILDENFLLYRRRSLRLLELMQEHDKSWSLYLFSSARVLESYKIEELLGLGVSWVWMGIEGANSPFAKLKQIDTRRLVKKLQSQGIRVLGSTIIGLHDHRPDQMDEVISYAVSHDTDFHQFMLYTPLPGTPLHEKHRNDGSLLSEGEVPLAEVHGQTRFNFRHPYLKPGQELQFLLKAFQEDFDVNGPSIVRLIRTTFEGWIRHRNHPEKRIRERFRREAKLLAGTHAGFVWATKKKLRHNKHVKEKAQLLLKRIYRHFGWRSRVMSRLIGSVIYFRMNREERRLAKGWTYEPPTFYQTSVEAVAPTCPESVLEFPELQNVSRAEQGSAAG